MSKYSKGWCYTCGDWECHYYDDPQRREQNLPLRRWTFYPATFWDKVLTWPYRAVLAIWRML